MKIGRAGCAALRNLGTLVSDRLVAALHAVVLSGERSMDLLSRAMQHRTPVRLRSPLHWPTSLAEGASL